MKLYYFAYGSNIHPIRLTKRIKSAQFISAYKLDNYKLKFNKISKDNSSKCNIELSSNTADKVYGVIYEIDELDLKKLDLVEGLNKGYIHKAFMLDAKLNKKSFFTYVAVPEFIDEDNKPYKWYKDMVIAGMEYYIFNPDYINNVKILEAKEDFDIIRQAKMLKILAEMMEY